MYIWLPRTWKKNYLNWCNNIIFHPLHPKRTYFPFYTFFFIVKFTIDGVRLRFCLLSEFVSGKKEESNCVEGNRFGIGMPPSLLTTKTMKRAKKINWENFRFCLVGEANPVRWNVCVRVIQWGVDSAGKKKKKQLTLTHAAAFQLECFNETRRTFAISGRTENHTRTYRTPFACVYST